MRCVADLCQQGRKPCPRRRACGFRDSPDAEAADAPITTPEQAMAWVPSWWTVIAAAVALTLAIVISAGVTP